MGGGSGSRLKRPRLVAAPRAPLPAGPRRCEEGRPGAPRSVGFGGPDKSEPFEFFGEKALDKAFIVLFIISTPSPPADLGALRHPVRPPGSRPPGAQPLRRRSSSDRAGLLGLPGGARKDRESCPQTGIPSPPASAFGRRATGGMSSPVAGWGATGCGSGARRDVRLALGARAQSPRPAAGTRARTALEPESREVPGFGSSGHGDPGSCGVLSRGGAQGRGDSTQLRSVRRSWRPELGAGRELSGWGVRPENRGPPLRPAIRSSSPARAQEKARCVPEAAGKLCFLQESRGLVKASSEDASGAARSKPNVTRAAPARKPLRPPGSDSSVLSKSSLPSHSRESQSIQIFEASRRAAQSRAGPTSRRGCFGWRDGAGRGESAQPAPQRAQRPASCAPRAPARAGQASGGRRPGPVSAGMCRLDAGPERRPLERAPAVTPGAPWPHVGLCCRLPSGEKKCPRS